MELFRLTQIRVVQILTMTRRAHLGILQALFRLMIIPECKVLVMA